jgi:hypothetical protein
MGEFKKIFTEILDMPHRRATRKDLEEIGGKDYYLKISVIILSMVTPFVIAIGCKFNSLSESWGSIFMPLFIINNAMTSYYIFSLRKWRIPALFLLLLTGFPVIGFRVIHNIFAVLFFLSCIYSLGVSKRMKTYLWLYLISAPVFIFSILWGEVLASVVLTSYHLHSLIEVRKILKKSNSIQ